ncbi:MAG: Lrp/AsnC family transcriptional regulator [Candidatus Bathyarchaeota archaeon]|jgi:DNA-binding Lrp family transcriptional regulator
MPEIDDLDRQIIELLMEDSRFSYREMAKQLGVSHANISSRVKRLEEEGVIRGYTVVTDPETLDLYPLCLRISAKAGADLSEIGKSIASLDRAQVVMRVSGECELLALAMCSDRTEAINLLQEVSMISGVDKAESHVVLESIKLSGKNLR